MVEQQTIPVVRTPDEFFKMPEEYQQLVIHLLRQHTEGELVGADDYLYIFYPLAPNAFERKVCCERAAEELDHYMRGAEVLEGIGYDASPFLKQSITQRKYYKTEGVEIVDTWLKRGLFSFLGETGVLMMIEEMAHSSYLPMAKMTHQVIIDEHVHVANGHRIVKQFCEEAGPEAIQAEVDKAWAMALDLFGKSDSERSRAYLRWGLRQYSNEEARQRFIRLMTPRLEALGLRVPGATDVQRKFL
jgi:ring-1,2-phenylacetyl-CoA epoxidase subunit PaaA